MYNNIGGKIKGSAVTIAVLEAVIAIIAGICVMAFGEESGTVGFVIIIAGVFLAWVSSWLLYGYGELIEKTYEIAQAVTYNSKSVKSSSMNEAMNIPKRNEGVKYDI